MTGQKVRLNNGLFAKIIEYRNENDIDIEFDDGLKLYSKTYKDFKDGNIEHPVFNSSSDVKVYRKRCEVQAVAKNKYKCKCFKCGLKKFLTAWEIMKHVEKHMGA